MSRSFRESYLGRPYQAVRGWYLGKKREAAKSARYRLAALVDEDGVPDTPRSGRRKWIRNGGGVRQSPDRSYEVIRRNRRKFMRKRREIS